MRRDASPEALEAKESKRESKKVFSLSKPMFWNMLSGWKEHALRMEGGSTLWNLTSLYITEMERGGAQSRCLKHYFEPESIHDYSLPWSMCSNLQELCVSMSRSTC